MKSLWKVLKKRAGSLSGGLGLAAVFGLLSLSFCFGNYSLAAPNECSGTISSQPFHLPLYQLVELNGSLVGTCLPAGYTYDAGNIYSMTMTSGTSTGNQYEIEWTACANGFHGGNCDIEDPPHTAQGVQFFEYPPSPFVDGANLYPGDLFDLYLNGVQLGTLPAAPSGTTATSTLTLIMDSVITTTVDTAEDIFTNYWPFILIFGIIAGLVAFFSKFINRTTK
jgi:hypothetical protein